MMIKNFLGIGLGCCVFFSASAVWADFEKMVVAQTKKVSQNLGFSDAFLAALPNCSPVTETRQEMGVDIIYSLKGFDSDGKCLLESSSQRDGMAAVTSCRFDKDDLSVFAESQRGVRQLMEKATSLNEILTDENYLISVGMMLDETKCHSKHSGYDPTKELRQKLEVCEPYQTEMNSGSGGSVLMRVVGQQGNLCQYVFQVKQKMPSTEDIKNLLGEENYQQMKEFIKDQSITTTCRFSPAAKTKYISLLAKTAISEGDGDGLEALTQLQKSYREVNAFLTSVEECETSFDS